MLCLHVSYFVILLDVNAQNFMYYTKLTRFITKDRERPMHRTELPCGFSNKSDLRETALNLQLRLMVKMHAFLELTKNPNKLSLQLLQRYSTAGLHF